MVFVICLAGGLLIFGMVDKRTAYMESKEVSLQTVMVLGLSDLAISTEARYTRHPAASDRVVPFMDHPGGMEHFPSGSFFQPVYK